MNRDALERTQTMLDGWLRRPSCLPNDDDEARSIARVVAPGLRLSPAEQADIYREQFWLRHRESLEEDFPTLRALLGKKGFDALTEHFLSVHPPTHFLLRELARPMGSFLQRHEPWNDDALLADCARIEWAFIDIFDAPEGEPLDAAGLAGAPSEAIARAQVRFSPRLRVVRLEHAAHRFRDAVRSKGVEPCPPRPERGITHIAVFRANDMRHQSELEPAEYRLHELLLAGEPLGEACEQALAETHEDDQARVAEALFGWFQRWAANGWLSAVELG